MPSPLLSPAAGLPSINAGVFAAGFTPGASTAAAAVGADGAAAGSAAASPFNSPFANQLSQSLALAAGPAAATAALPGEAATVAATGAGAVPTPAAPLTAGMPMALPSTSLAAATPVGLASTPLTSAMQLSLTPAPAASTPGSAPAPTVGIAAPLGAGSAPVADVEPPSAAAPGVVAPTLPSDPMATPLPPGAVAVPAALGEKPSKSPAGQAHTLPMPKSWTTPWRGAAHAVGAEERATPDEPVRADETASSALQPSTSETTVPLSRNERQAPAPETAGDAAALSMSAWIAQLLPPAAPPVSLPPSEGARAAGNAKSAATPATGAPGQVPAGLLLAGSDGSVSAAMTSPAVPDAKATPLPVRDAAPPRRADTAAALPGASARADANRVGDRSAIATNAHDDASETVPPVATEPAAPVDTAPANQATTSPVPPAGLPTASAITPLPATAIPPATAAASEVASSAAAPTVAAGEGLPRARQPETATARRETPAAASTRTRADEAADRTNDSRASAGLTTASAAEASLPSARDESRPVDAETVHKPAFTHLLEAANQAHASAQAPAAGGAHAAASAAVNVALPTPVLAPEFKEALGAQVSVLARDGVQHAELHLNPGDMGPISVRIALDGTQAQVDFGVDSAATRALVESGMPELASALRDAGLTLTGGGVSQHPRGQAGDTPQGGRPGDGPPSGQPGGIRQRGGSGDDTGVPLPRPRTLRMAGGVDLYA